MSWSETMRLSSLLGPYEHKMARAPMIASAISGQSPSASS
jgi:hypothetical protein